MSFRITFTLLACVILHFTFYILHCAAAEVTIKDVTLGDVVVVAQSAYPSTTPNPGNLNNSPYWDEMNPGFWPWAYYRQPKIMRMPDGDIVYAYQMNIDIYADQGSPSPMLISKDEGKTWDDYEPPHPAMKAMTQVLSYVGNGEYFFIPASAGYHLDKVHPLPPALPIDNQIHVDGMVRWTFHKLEDFHQDIQDWFKNTKGLRWTAENGWQVEQVDYPHEKRVVFSFDESPAMLKTKGHWTQKQWTETHLAVGHDGTLYYADYWSNYEDENGMAPRTWRTHIMASKDRGRTWERRSTIVAPGDEIFCEPMV